MFVEWLEGECGLVLVERLEGEPRGDGLVERLCWGARVLVERPERECEGSSGWREVGGLVERG